MRARIDYPYPFPDEDFIGQHVQVVVGGPSDEVGWTGFVDSLRQDLPDEWWVKLDNGRRMSYRRDHLIITSDDPLPDDYFA